MRKPLASVFKEAFVAFRRDNVSSLGAGLAYYLLFSIAPVLLIGVALAGWIFGERVAEVEVVRRMSSLIGPTAARAIQDVVLNARRPERGIAASSIGLTTFLFAAFGLFRHLRFSLNTIWKVPAARRHEHQTMRRRLLTAGVMFAVIVFLLLSLVVETAVALAGRFAAARLVGGESLWAVLQMVLSVLLISILFGLLFRYLPDVRLQWRDVWPGAVLTAFLFAIGKFVVGLYLRTSAIGSGYGAAGSIVVVLVWAYWSSQIFFFGIEFTRLYAADR